MSAPVYLTGVAACTKFATPALRRACVAHRLSTLERYASGSRRNEHGPYRAYATLVESSAPALEKDQTPRRSSNARKRVRHNDRGEQRNGPQSTVHESIRQLDPYLPLQGRSGTWVENLAAFHGVRSPQSLPGLLQAIDQNFKHGALTSLALEQGRWLAYVYLIEGLVKAYGTFRSSLQSEGKGRSIWAKVRLPPPTILTGYGRQQFYPEALRGSKSDEDDLAPFQVPSSFGADEAEDLHMFQWSVGKIWQSLGMIVIEAAQADRDQSEAMMSSVYRVLSVMHSEDCMHPMIYQFDPSDVAEIRRKSPYLQSMSSRMMTTLSDSTWKAMEEKETNKNTLLAAYAEVEGINLEHLYPSVRVIGHEAWLDLILWSCVLGGHNASGMSIVREMTSRQGDSQWRSVTWQDLLDENMRNTDATNARKLRDRFDKAAGSFEGYSNDPPILTLPPRTISSEVVVALIEILPLSSDRSSEANVARELGSLKHLLSTSSQTLDREFLKVIALRAVDSGNINPELQPAILQSISDAVALRSRSAPQPTQLQQIDEAGSKDIAEVHGLFSHRALAALINMGDINGALKAFMNLQSWVDGRKQAALQSFFSTSLSVAESQSEDVDLGSIEASQEFYASPIPASTMASFLDLLTKYRLYDLGIWLLASNDPDGPMISHNVRTSAVFMPALTRFGVAIKEYRIVEEIMNHVQDDRSLFTPELIQALVIAFTEFKQFDRVKFILRMMRDDRHQPVGAEEIMALAQQVMRLETRDAANAREQVRTASQILADVLERKYLGDYTQDSRILRAHHDHMHQLYRMLSSIRGCLSDLPVDPEKFESYRATSPVPVDAFNTLLKGVVESQGPEAGRRLVQRWCLLPSDDSAAQLLDNHRDVPVLVDTEIAAKYRLALPATMDPHQGGGDQVVLPNRYTIDIVMDAAMNAREAEQASTDRAPVAKLRGPMIGWDDVVPSASNEGGDADSTLEWCQATLKKLEV